jgi:hypothetical protein
MTSVITFHFGVPMGNRTEGGRGNWFPRGGNNKTEGFCDAASLRASMSFPVGSNEKLRLLLSGFFNSRKIESNKGWWGKDFPRIADEIPEEPDCSSERSRSASEYELPRMPSAALREGGWGKNDALSSFFCCVRESPWYTFPI